METSLDVSNRAEPTESPRPKSRRQRGHAANSREGLHSPVVNLEDLRSCKEEHQNGDLLEMPDIPIPQPRCKKKQSEAASPASRGGDNISDPSVGVAFGQTSSRSTDPLEELQLGQEKHLPIAAIRSDIALIKRLNNSLALQQQGLPSERKRVRKILPKSPPVVTESWIGNQRSLSEVSKEPESMEVMKTVDKDKNSDESKSQRRLGLRSNQVHGCVSDDGNGEEPKGKKPKIDVMLQEEGKLKLKVKKPFRKRQCPEVINVALGDLVWGKLQGFDWWPARIMAHWEAGQDPPANGYVWLRWFGDQSYSQLQAFADRISPFGNFKEKCNTVKLKQSQYRRSLLAAVEEAARRANKNFADEIDSDTADLNASSSLENKADNSSPEESSAKHTKKFDLSKTQPALSHIEKCLLLWALNDFLPTGPDGFKPSLDDVDESGRSLSVIPTTRPGSSNRQLSTTPTAPPSVSSRASKAPLTAGPKSASTNSTMKPNPTPTSSPAASKVPDARKKCVTKDQQDRLSEVRSGDRQLEDLCLGCGSTQLVVKHPLFIGGLCVSCKESFLENCYLFDEDGTQMYCTICSDGMEVYLCDSPGCARAYCGMCIEKLCGKEELDKVKDATSWICYMCRPSACIGLLKIQPDWQLHLQTIFQTGNRMQFDPFPPCKPIALAERKPVRVLGLFDGIGTGLLVLKELGFEVEKYVASEIDSDAIKVTRVRHPVIAHVGDIRKMTEKWIQENGPFDLVVGGSPCNDLSVANPGRKGVYEGTGRLFFEFYRLLQHARPCPHEEPRPFFWLFENVVSMRAEDRDTISRFLQCNPLVLDARDISPANRARYFWGNLPGMNRPAVPLPCDRLTLQDCLEPNCNRVAKVQKIRTVTTKANSIKQTTKMVFPVEEEDNLTGEWKGDVLWCTELERAFGFPDHYTDVANMGRVHRQRLLGRSWSVPVIRHLFSPLKDYFKCRVEGSSASS